MKNYETGLEYANTDPSLHCNTLPRGHRGPTWQSVWIYLLRMDDKDAAQLVRDLNAAHSNECHYGDHDFCHYPHCECVCHRASVVKFETEPLVNCAEKARCEEEREVA